MKKRYFFMILGISLLACALLGLTVSAEGETLPLTLTPALPRLVDGNEGSVANVTELKITSGTPMEHLYLMFYTAPSDFVLVANGVEKSVENSFLKRCVGLTKLFGAPLGEVTLRFPSQVGLLEIYAFGENLPDWVQLWEEPCEKADLCLMTTHADDEQLFFAGVLPYYAGEKGYEVQVIYFTDHVNEPLRRHELLNGLWKVGVTHYPVISPFPDLYSESEALAEQQFAYRGFDRRAVIGFQVEMLRRFRPLVVVGHDPAGEYGHGQHRLNSATLREAVNLAGKADQYPDTASQYGVWEVPKTYLHLYEENKIVMDWDIPLESFGGKTAFQVTQEGFACHGSQQYTWFRTWLTGNGSITRADQITTYSPCSYGLFRSTVGADVAKNDFFENLKTWEEQRLEEEARIRAEETARKLALLEAERERAEKEALEALFRQKAKEEEARRLEQERLSGLEKDRADKMLLPLLGITVVLVAIAALSLFRQSRRRPVRRRR